MLESLRNVLTDPVALGVWVVLVIAGLGWLLYDLKARNPEIKGLMKAVWILTVAYSGPIGAAVYAYSGRKQIAHDSLWRRAFRSVAHCYSGCGMGEIFGVTVSVGLFAMGQYGVALVTFACAYIAGFALTVGPLMQEGVGFRQAMWDAFLAETPSITIMEIVAIGADLWLAGSATIGEALFWSSLAVSLSCGLLAAYPVNVLLIHWGVKEGMHSPKEMAEHARQAETGEARPG
jgi:hypothetical protein